MKRRSFLAQVTAGLAVAPTGFSIAAANRRAGGGYSSSPDLQRRISAYVASTGVPGAQLGILKDGQVAVAAAGVLSKRTNLPASPDSVFQIGSNSKVWTATMMMQLVDAGQLDLDAPVVQYLPNFKVADGQTTQRLTVRHLVSHRSGIPGNIPALIRTGANTDKLQNYVTALADIPPDVPIGVFSYSNSAFIVLGRIIEAVTGQSWEARLQSSICQPLGLDNVCTSAEQAIVHSAAVGHFRLPDNEYTPVPSWGMPPAMGPAAFIVTSAESVLRMNQLHLSGSSPTGAGGVLFWRLLIFQGRFRTGLALPFTESSPTPGTATCNTTCSAQPEPADPQQSQVIGPTSVFRRGETRVVGRYTGCPRLFPFRLAY